MTLPDPLPGLIIRHAFLWSHELAQGHSEAAKSRPCVIVTAAARREGGAIRVTVAPITHTPPNDETVCVGLPAKVARELGLDDDRQWLRFDELNLFDWPGFDLSPVPSAGGKYDYGMLPRPLFERIRTTILARVRAGERTAILNRDT